MIENEILSSVFSEEMFHKVRFLQAKDFENKINQRLWAEISRHKGNTVSMVAAISHTERAQYANAVSRACLGVGMVNVAQMGLKLVELKFTRLLNVLLDDLIKRSESIIEKHYLKEIKKEMPKIDIIELSEGVLFYFEDKARDEATTYAKQRLKDFSEYVAKRIQTIKTITNGD